MYQISFNMYNILKPHHDFWDTLYNTAWLLCLLLCLYFYLLALKILEATCVQRASC
jgi:hypothetical protein